MLKLFRRLLCDHRHSQFVRNVYGDEINLLNARSIWKCGHCGKVSYSAILHRPGDPLRNA